MKRIIFSFILLVSLWITPFAFADFDFNVQFISNHEVQTATPPTPLTSWDMTSLPAAWYEIINTSDEQCLVVVDEAGSYCSFASQPLNTPFGTSTPFEWNGTDFPYFNDISTRIITVFPYNNETVATSSIGGRIGTIANLNPADIEKGYQVRQKWILQSDQQAVVANQALLWEGYSVPFLPAGTVTFGATSTKAYSHPGRYTVVTQIVRETWTNQVSNFLFGIDLGLDIIDSTTTTFIMGGKTNYDTFVDTTNAGLDILTSSSTVSYASCSTWTGFNLLDCSALLFGWQTASMDALFWRFANDFKYTAPIGYVTRVFDILTASSSTSTDIILAFSLPADSSMPGDAFSLNISQGLRDADALLRTPFPMKTGSDLDLWDIVIPIFQVLFATAYIYYVIHRLTGLPHLSGGTRMFGKREKRSGITSDEYRYKETLYRLSQRP